MAELELYSEQDVETKIIVPKLRELGYVEEDSKRNVVIRFQHPLPVQQGRQRKTIFIDVAVFVDDVPVIIIDSKNPRQFLTENDREQVISYARLIGQIAPYSVLCNGRTWQYYDTITKQQLPSLPAYNELLAALQRQRLSARQRETLVSQATRTLFAIDSARELSRYMRQCHDVIRNLRGWDPTRAFDELSKLLFCKMYEEREVAEGRREENRFSIDSVRRMRQNGVEIIDAIWRETINSDRYADVFSDAELESGIDLPPEAVDRIVEILEDKSLTLTDLDVKGVAFEEFLAATYRGGGLGQYFTPREVVAFMVDLVDPAIGERIIDPACGTGGFLIRAFNVVNDRIDRAELSQEEKTRHRTRLANECLVGIDWEARAARTCKMNMIIHGDGHAGVYHSNALDIQEVNTKVSQRRQSNPNAPEVTDATFDIVLTNPPFGARDSLARILANYEMGTRRSQSREILFLERCIKLLKPGGRMAIVIPEGILSNITAQPIRDYISQHCIVKAVIRLPQDAFKMSQGAACTSVLYLVKKDPDNPALSEQGSIFFARAEYIGISPSGKPIEQNDLLAIRENFRLFEEDHWDGIELDDLGDDQVNIIRGDPTSSSKSYWLEPEVNRTSLLYDRLNYVLLNPKLTGRFSYTYYHPEYFRVMQSIVSMSTVSRLQDLCVDGYPVRGRQPPEESSEGIPVIKVRNVTGGGIDIDTDYAPDNEEIRSACQNVMIQQNDVLITSTGEGTIGKVDIYPYEDPALADGHVAICRLREGVDPFFIAEFLRSEYGQMQMLRNVSGSTGQTELLIRHVEDIRIPCPAPEVQTQIVSMLKAARQEAEALLNQAEEIRQAGAEVIAKAQSEMYQQLNHF